MSSGAQGLCIDRVHVWRGDRHVLKGVSLVLDTHELLHISGPNGTGKTTLLRVAMARVLASRASLWLLDEPFTNLDRAGSELLSGLLADHVACGGMALVVAHHDLDIGASVRRLDLAG